MSNEYDAEDDVNALFTLTALFSYADGIVGTTTSSAVPSTSCTPAIVVFAGTANTTVCTPVTRRLNLTLYSLYCPETISLLSNVPITSPSTPSRRTSYEPVPKSPQRLHCNTAPTPPVSPLPKSTPVTKNAPPVSIGSTGLLTPFTFSYLNDCGLPHAIEFASGTIFSYGAVILLLRK